MALERLTATTRSAFLELQDERELIREGYDLLDQKRIMLAGELLRQLDVYRACLTRCQSLHQRALQSLAAAINHHGLDELTIYPPLPLRSAELHERWQSFLGVPVSRATLETEITTRSISPVYPSPEAEGCALQFLTLLEISAELGSLAGNLWRLCTEYVQTERRAKALENVLLPEIEGALKIISDQLEAVDQEDVIRVRTHSKEML